MVTETFELPSSLRQTLTEGSKTSDVDIQLMLSNVERCESIVQQLLLSEQDALNSVRKH